MTRATENGPKLLLIGPMPSEKDFSKEVIGGAKVSFAETVRQLELRGFELSVTSTVRQRPKLPLQKIFKTLIHEFRAFIRVVWGVLWKARRFDLVFLNMSAYSALVASTIWIMCRVRRRPLVIRFFGSNLGVIYQRYGPLRLWLIDKTCLRSSLVYVETQRLHQELGERENVRWLPNTRNIVLPPHIIRQDKDKVRKLVFISQLRMEKGLYEMLEACRSLPDGCHLQVFGPQMPNTDFSLFDGHPRATYAGVLKPSEVPMVLAEHDLLLFAGHQQAEGYPGIIIEAFQCGVPVVATTVGGVSELVEHEESGLLVEPRSSQDLKAAIERLLDDPALYRRLCGGAERRGEFFRSSHWYARMAEELRKVAVS